MSEQIERQYNQQKKRRRTRKDEQGRNFTCPCGKSYLSYPALYTHIKTKHQGKVKHYLAKAPKQDQSVIKPQLLEYGGQSQDPLAHVKDIVQKYFPGDNGQEYPNTISQQNLLYINSLISPTIQDPPSNNNNNDKNQTSQPQNPIIPTQIQPKPQDISNNLNEPIDSIFSKFLTQIRDKTKIKQQAFKYLCDFFAQFHANIIEQRKDQQYCKENNGAQLPNYFNSLILGKKVPDVCARNFGSIGGVNGSNFDGNNNNQNNDNHDIVHTENDNNTDQATTNNNNKIIQKQKPSTKNLILACKVLFYFGIWLFDHRYTTLSAKFNVLNN